MIRTVAARPLGDSFRVPAAACVRRTSGDEKRRDGRHDRRRNASGSRGRPGTSHTSGSGKFIASPRRVAGACWRIRARRSADANEAQSIARFITLSGLRHAKRDRPPDQVRVVPLLHSRHGRTERVDLRHGVERLGDAPLQVPGPDRDRLAVRQRLGPGLPAKPLQQRADRGDESRVRRVDAVQRVVHADRKLHRIVRSFDARSTIRDTAPG